MFSFCVQTAAATVVNLDRDEGEKKSISPCNRMKRVDDVIFQRAGRCGSTVQTLDRSTLPNSGEQNVRKCERPTFICIMT